MKRKLTFWQMLGRVLAVLCFLFVILIIIFPLFAKARQNIRNPSTGCLSNEKQIGLGVLQYEDNNDYLMPPTTHAPKKTWRVAVYDYIKSNDVYKCPADDRNMPGPDGHFSSYAMNTGAILPMPGAKPQILQSALYPKSLVLLCEVQNTTDADFDIGAAAPDAHILAVRHTGGSNYLLADGHAKWFRPSAFTYVPPADAQAQAQ